MALANEELKSVPSKKVVTVEDSKALKCSLLIKGKLPVLLDEEF